MNVTVDGQLLAGIADERFNEMKAKNLTHIYNLHIGCDPFGLVLCRDKCCPDSFFKLAIENGLIPLKSFITLTMTSLYSL
ncbi:hypothetical protein [Chryseosolibacter indicus]|uniref:Uncharacterized protein n=1 Tax=Chryseosolibacter indicus TaxID=2782351 RepID=A0ABS5VUY3_9BACT|nr:hypothetical protein [Chryseosolibacter indicus]MBT1704632.1 hypothetical protein [Chryseosolibacter indicus]